MKTCKLGMSLILQVIFTFLIISSTVAQQIWPVQVTGAMIPPRSLDLDVYTSQRTQDLFFNAVLNDPVQSSVQVTLDLSIEHNGQVIYKTDPNFFGPPLTLSQFQLEQLDGGDLQPYLTPQALTGANNTGMGSLEIPEGFNRICLQVYGMDRTVPISNKFCVQGSFQLNQPPQPTLPVCGDQMPFPETQNVIFNWSPMHIGSSNSPVPVEYQFELVELPMGTNNANDAFESALQLYQTTTMVPALLYTQAEPMLQPDRIYAWRVKAYSLLNPTSKLFQNEGYSEVCTFMYYTGDAPNTDINGEDNPAPTGCEVFNTDYGPVSGGDLESFPIVEEDIVKLGYFNMEITQAIAGAAGFSGEGLVEFPMFKSKIKVNFSGLRVNANMRVFDAENVEAAVGQQFYIDPSQLQPVNVPNLINDTYVNNLNSYFENGQGVTKLVSGFNPADPVAVELPIGLDKEDENLISIIGIKFTPRNAYLNMVSWNNEEGGDLMRFAATAVQATPFGMKSGSHLVLLDGSSGGSIPITNAFEIAYFGNNSTIMNCDCQGYKDLNLTPSIQISSSLLVQQGNGKPVILDLKNNTNTPENYVGDVKNVPHFYMNTLPDFLFKPKKGKLDLSETEKLNLGNSLTNYTEPDNPTWRGLLMENVDLELPNEYDFTGNGNKLKLNSDQLFIDAEQVAFGSFTKENMLSLEDGKMGNWAYSVDKFGIEINQGQTNGATLEGKVQVPVFADLFDYSGTLQANNSGQIILGVPVPETELAMDLWKAKFTPAAGSFIDAKLIEVDGTRSFFPKGSFDGALSIELTDGEFTDNIKGNAGALAIEAKVILGVDELDFNLQDIDFQGFVIDPFALPNERFVLNNVNLDNTTVVIGGETLEVGEVTMIYKEKTNESPEKLGLRTVILKGNNKVEFTFWSTGGNGLFSFDGIQIETLNVQCECTSMIVPPSEESWGMLLDELIESEYGHLFKDNAPAGSLASFGVNKNVEGWQSILKTVLREKLDAESYSGFPTLNSDTIILHFLNKQKLNYEDDGLGKIRGTVDIAPADLTFEKVDSHSGGGLPIDLTNRLNDIGVDKSNIPSYAKLLITGFQLPNKRTNWSKATMELTLLVKLASGKYLRFVKGNIPVGTRSVNFTSLYMHLAEEVENGDPDFPITFTKGDGKNTLSTGSYAFLSCTHGFEFINAQGFYKADYTNGGEDNNNKIKYRHATAQNGQNATNARFVFTVNTNNSNVYNLNQFIVPLTDQYDEGKKWNFTIEGGEQLIFRPSGEGFSAFIDYDNGKKVSGSGLDNSFKGLFFKEIEVELDGFKLKDDKPLMLPVQDLTYEHNIGVTYTGSYENPVSRSEGALLGGWKYDLSKIEFTIDHNGLDSGFVAMEGNVLIPIFAENPDENIDGLQYASGFIPFSGNLTFNTVDDKFEPKGDFSVDSEELEDQIFQIPFVPGLQISLSGDGENQTPSSASNGSAIEINYNSGNKEFEASCNLRGAAGLWVTQDILNNIPNVNMEEVPVGIELGIEGLFFEDLKINDKNAPSNCTGAGSFGGIKSLSFGTWGFNDPDDDDPDDPDEEDGGSDPNNNNNSNASNTGGLGGGSGAAAGGAKKPKRGFQGFPVTLGTPRFACSGQNEYRFTLPININLMRENKDSEGKTSQNANTAGLKAESEMGIVVGMSTEGMNFKRIELGCIMMEGKFGPVEMTGGLSILRSDGSATKWGDGFKALLDVSIADKFNVKSIAQFGSTTDDPDGSRTNKYRYFFVDLETVWENGIPLGHPAIKLYGAGGGFFYNMSVKKDPIEKGEANDFSANSNDDNSDCGVGEDKLFPGVGLSQMSYEPNEGMFGGHIKAIAGGPSPQTFVGDIVLDLEMGRNSDNTIGVQTMGVAGHAYIQAESVAKRMDSYMAYAYLALRYDFVNERLTGNFGLEADIITPPLDRLAQQAGRLSDFGVSLPGGLDKFTDMDDDLKSDLEKIPFVTRLQIPDPESYQEALEADPSASTTADGSFFVNFGGTDAGKWNFKFGGAKPKDRIKMRFNALGFVELFPSLYFQAGHDLDEMPPIEDLVPNWNGGSGGSSRPSPMLFGSGKGMIMGMSIVLPEKKFEYMPFRAFIEGGMGFDLSMIQYDKVTCNGEEITIGVNNWYMRGQAYAYMRGGMDLFFDFKIGPKRFKGEVNIFEVAAALALQARFPNPSYFEGRLQGRYSILGGLKKGDCDFKLSFGDKGCDFEVENKEFNIEEAGIPIVKESFPKAGTTKTELSIFESPHVELNEPVGKTYSFPKLDTDGNQTGMYHFRIAMGYVKVTRNENDVPETFTGMVGKKINVSKNGIWPASVKDEFRLEYEFYWEQKNGNVWEPVLNDADKKITETGSIPFNTGAMPSTIVVEALDYHAPARNHMNWYEGLAEPKIGFATDDFAYLFPKTGSEYKDILNAKKSRGEDVTEVISIDGIPDEMKFEYAVVLEEYPSGSQDISNTFTIPITSFPGNNKFTAPVIEYVPIAGLSEPLEIVRIKEVDGKKVAFPDLDHIGLNPDHFYNIRILRKPIVNEALIESSGLSEATIIDAYTKQLYGGYRSNEDPGYWFATSKFNSLYDKMANLDVTADLPGYDVSSLDRYKWEIYDYDYDSYEAARHFHPSSIDLTPTDHWTIGNHLSPSTQDEVFDKYEAERIFENYRVEYANSYAFENSFYGSYGNNLVHPVLNGYFSAVASSYGANKDFNVYQNLMKKWTAYGDFMSMYGESYSHGVLTTSHVNNKTKPTSFHVLGSFIDSRSAHVLAQAKVVNKISIWLVANANSLNGNLANHYNDKATFYNNYPSTYQNWLNSTVENTYTTSRKNNYTGDIKIKIPKIESQDILGEPVTDPELYEQFVLTISVPSNGPNNTTVNTSTGNEVGTFTGLQIASNSSDFEIKDYPSDFEVDAFFVVRGSSNIPVVYWDNYRKEGHVYHKDQAASPGKRAVIPFCNFPNPNESITSHFSLTGTAGNGYRKEQIYPNDAYHFYYRKGQTWKKATISSSEMIGNVTKSFTNVNNANALLAKFETAVTPFTNPSLAIPGLFNATDFDKGGNYIAYYDNSNGNAGGQFRQGDDVDVYTSSAGGYMVGNFATGEWLSYLVDVETEATYNYILTYESTGNSNHQVEFLINGQSTHSHNFANAGNQQKTTEGSFWIGETGQTRLRIKAKQGGFKFVKIQFSRVNAQPFAGTFLLPGKLEVENFNNGGASVAYFDTGNTNTGNYNERSEGVDLSEADGKIYLTDIQNGEWLTYEVSVLETAQFKLSFAAANTDNAPAGTFRFFLDDEEVFTQNPTGILGLGATNFVEVNGSTVTLEKGDYQLKVLIENPGANLDYIAFNRVQLDIPAGNLVTLPSNTAVQFQDLPSGGEGVAFHDISGNQPTGTSIPNVEKDEWLKYGIKVSESGAYPMYVTHSGGSGNLEFNLYANDHLMNTEPIKLISNNTSLKSYIGHYDFKQYAEEGSNYVELKFAFTAGSNFKLTKFELTNPQLTPYGGTAPEIPTAINFKNFANGGQGVAYFDANMKDNNAARNGQYVDAQGANVANVEKGEWLKYPIKVSTTALYNLEITYNSGSNTSAGIAMKLNGVVYSMVDLPIGSGMQTKLTDIYLEAGDHVIEFEAFAEKAMTLGKFTFSVPSDAGIALGFDGTTDFLNIASVNLKNTSFTIEFWEAKQTGKTGIIASHGLPSGSQKLSLGYSESRKFTVNFGGGAIHKTGLQDTESEWRHWAMVYDKQLGKLRLYLNGNLEKEESVNVYYTQLGQFKIGRNIVGGNYGGSIDEFRIWERALSGLEINDYMYCQPPNDSWTLKSYFNFNDKTAKNLVNNIVPQGNENINENSSRWLPSPNTSYEENCNVLTAPTYAVEKVIEGNPTPISQNTTFNFGENYEPKIQSFQITNTGESELVLSHPDTIALSGANNFQLERKSDVVIYPGESSRFEVAFEPEQSSSDFSASLSFETNAAENSTFNLSLNGAYTPAPPVPLAPELEMLDDGQATVISGETAEIELKLKDGDFIRKTYIITNNGNADLTWSNPISLSGNDASSYSLEQPQTPVTLAPGATESVTVEFAATTVKKHLAKLTLSSNDPNQAIFKLNLEGSVKAGTPYQDIAQIVPGYIEAEKFDEGGRGLAYNDDTRRYGNNSSRAPETVDLANYGSRAAVAYINRWEWAQYTVDVKEDGYYYVYAIAAKPSYYRKRIIIDIDGKRVVSYKSLRRTGRYDRFYWTYLNRLYLKAGEHVIKWTAPDGGFSLDALVFDQVTAGPYGGAAAKIPGRIEAEHFDEGLSPKAYYDSDRRRGNCSLRDVHKVDLERSGSRINIGHIHRNEWAQYTVDIEVTGLYEAYVRYSTPHNNKKIGLNLNGKNVQKTLPRTGNYRYYRTERVGSNLQLSKGQHKLKWSTTTGAFNLDYIEFRKVLSPEIAISEQGNSQNSGASIDIGNLNPGAAIMPSSTFTITNNGDANLNLNGTIKISGTNASYFKIEQPANSTLTPGSTETFKVIYEPSDAGQHNAVVSINSNATNQSSFKINVSGEYLGEGEIVLKENNTTLANASQINVGKANVGASVQKTFTINNTGTGTLILSAPRVTGANKEMFSVESFAVTNQQSGETNVASNNSVTFKVTYTPSIHGNHEAVLTVYSNDLDEAEIKVDLAAEGLPINIALGKSTTNSGLYAGRSSDRLVDGKIGNTTSEFYSSPKEAGTWAEIDLGGFYEISEIEIFNRMKHHNFHMGKYHLLIGNAPFSTSKDINQSIPMAVWESGLLKNVPLLDDWKVTIPPGTVGRYVRVQYPNNYSGHMNLREMRVYGKPAPAGYAPEVKMQTKFIAADDAEPLIIANSSIIDLGNLEAGQNSLSKKFAVDNIGELLLTVNGNIELSGADKDYFSIKQLLNNGNIPFGQSDTFNIIYNPLVGGEHNATVTINSNDASNQTLSFDIVAANLEVPVIELQMAGVNLESGGNLGFGTYDHTNANNNERTVTIANTGGAPLTISGTPVISGSGKSHFSTVAASSTNIPKGDTASFKVTYKPTALGTQNAIVTVNSNAGTYKLNLSGNRDHYPYKGIYATIPGKIEAEDFNEGGQNIGYYETTAAGRGGYRNNDGVDLSKKTNASNGYRIGWTGRNEWTNYSIEVTEAGNYDLLFHYGKPSRSAKVELSIGNTTLTGGVITLPKTPNWDIRKTHNAGTVNLAAGKQTIKFKFIDDLALDYFALIPSIDFPLQTDICHNATPISLEATPEGGTFSGAGVNAKVFTPSSTGDKHVKYSFDVNGFQAEKTNKIKVHALPTANAGSDVTSQFGETVTLGSNNTAANATYEWFPTIGLSDATVKRPTLSISGSQTYTLTVTSDKGCVSTDEVVVTAQMPFSGTPIQVPGTIEAEHADLGGQNVSFNDNTPTNKGALGDRNDAVDIYGTSKASGGLYIGDIRQGEWLEYTVNVNQAGNYLADFHVAAAGSGGSFKLEKDGTNLTGNIASGNTGAGDTFVKKTKEITLSQGYNVLRFVAIGQNFNLDKIVIREPNQLSINLPVTEICQNEASITLSATPEGGTFSGTGVSGNQFNPTTVGNQTITYTYTDNGANLTTTASINVIAAPVANAGADKTAQYEGTSVTLGTKAQSGVTYSWNPTKYLSNANIAQPTIGYKNDHQTTDYTLTAINSKGCSSTDVVQYKSDRVNVVFNLPEKACWNDVITLSATPAGGEFTSWGANINGNILTFPENSSYSNNLDYKDFTIRYKLPFGWNNYVDKTIEVYKPDPDAGEDRAINSGASVTLGGDNNYIGSSGATYSWSPQGGNYNSSNAKLTVSPSQETVYTLTKTIGGCVNTDKVRIRIAGPYGGTAATIPGVIEAENYDIGIEGTAFHDETAGNIGGKGNRNDNMDIYDGKGNGLSLELDQNEWAEYTINVATAGNYNFSFLVRGTEYSGNINVKVPSGYGTGQSYSIYTHNSNEWRLEPGNHQYNNSQYLNAGEQKIRLYGTQYSKDIRIDKIYIRKNEDIIFGTPTTVCRSDDPLILDALPSEGVWNWVSYPSNFDVPWNLSVYVNGKGYINQFIPNVEGEYKLEYNSNSGGRKTLTINVTSGPTANAGNIRVEELGTQIRIGPTTDGSSNYTYSWSPTLGLSNPNVERPTLTVNADQDYTLTVTSPNGCVDTDVAKVRLFSWGNIPTSVCEGESFSINPTPQGGTLYQRHYQYQQFPVTITYATSVWFNDSHKGTMNFKYNFSIDGTSFDKNTQVEVTKKPGNIATEYTLSGGNLNLNPLSEFGEISLGAAPYTYKWSTGSTSSNINITSGGTYIVTITNGDGCTDEITFFEKQVTNLTQLSTTSIKESSNYSSAYPKENLKDGNPSTFWHSNNERKPWIIIDLGSEKAIEEIQFWNRQDCCQNRMSEYEIWIGNDLEWNGDRINNKLWKSGERSDSALNWTVGVPAGTKGRYIQIIRDHSSWWKRDPLNIGEIKVMGFK